MAVSAARASSLVLSEAFGHAELDQRPALGGEVLLVG
jgi:hypothetical protein